MTVRFRFQRQFKISEKPLTLENITLNSVKHRVSDVRLCEILMAIAYEIVMGIYFPVVLGDNVKQSKWIQLSYEHSRPFDN